MNPEEGFRDAQNALAVSQKLGDKNFETFCLQVIASYYRNAGRHAEAERALNQALALAKERDLSRKIAPLTIDLGRSHFDRGDYATALQLLRQALGDGLGPDSAQARVHLGRVHVRLADFSAGQAELSQAFDEAKKRGNSGPLPLLHTAMGELCYESGDHREARKHFQEAAALRKNDEPDESTVEARAYLGLLDGLEGKPEQGLTILRSSLEQARRMGRFSLEARLRVFLARLYVSQRRFDDAIRTLNDVPADAGRTLSPELEAQVHYWRGQADYGKADRANAQGETGVARKLIEGLRQSLPVTYRVGFASRPDIRVLVQ